MGRAIRGVEWVTLGLLWGVSARSYAQAVSLSQQLAAVPLDVAILAFVLSMVGGLASLTRRLADDTRPARALAEAAKHLTGAAAAGAATFGMLLAADASLGTQIAALTIAGFAGSVALDWYVEKTYPERRRRQEPDAPKRRRSDYDPQ